MIDSFPNKDFNNYLNILKSSKDVIGCGFLDFNCEEPLILPPYQKEFKIKDYKRVKVYPKNIWQDTGLTVSAGESFTLIAYGRVNLSDKLLFQINQPPKDRLLFSINKKNKFGLNNLQQKGYFTVENWSGIKNGTLYSSIREGNINDFPYPDDWLYGNNGYFMVDIFIHDSDENIEKFLYKIINENKENKQIKNKNFIFDTIITPEEIERDKKYNIMKSEFDKLDFNDIEKLDSYLNKYSQEDDAWWFIDSIEKIRY